MTGVPVRPDSGRARPRHGSLGRVSRTVVPERLGPMQNQRKGGLGRRRDRGRHGAVVVFAACKWAGAFVRGSTEEEQVTRKGHSKRINPRNASFYR